MPLIDLKLEVPKKELPRDVRVFLREAERRIRVFHRDCRVPSHVPSDYRRAYQTLRAVEEAGLAPGNTFCEWGSGFGVIACLAAMLEFDACGVEVEKELIDAARELADDFGLPVQFARGSFIPAGYDFDPTGRAEFTWLTTDARSGYPALGLDPDSFDLIFAYPWPDEEQLTDKLFERRGGMGALLLTNHGTDDLRLRRKVSGKPLGK